MSKKGLTGVLLLIVGFVCACGASPEYASSAPALAPVENVSLQKAWDVDEAGEGYRADTTTSSAVDGDAQAWETVNRMIIWNADISLVVEDAQAAGASPGPRP
jgi:hypothetical protein